MAASETHISGKSVWRAFRDALQASGIQKRAFVHTLRHSYATHLLEIGINMRLIQSYLGHHSMRTTCGYTHLTRRSEELAAYVITTHGLSERHACRRVIISRSVYRY